MLERKTELYPGTRQVIHGTHFCTSNESFLAYCSLMIQAIICLLVCTPSAIINKRANERKGLVNDSIGTAPLSIHLPIVGVGGINNFRFFFYISNLTL
jgi:hypothetical protein